MSRVALRSSRRACASAAPAWLQQPRGGAMPLAVSARGAAAARSAAGTCGGSMGVGPRNRVSSTSCISCSAGVSSCCSSRTVAATRRAGSGTSSTALRRRLAAGSVVASLARDGRGARERTAAYAIPKGISVAESIELDELTSSEDEAEMESFSENYAAKSTLDIVRERTGWLGAFCIGLVLAAGVVEGFDELIAKHVELSFFVPLIMGHGGNSGAQATCAVIRALALKQISFRNVGAVVAKEAAAGAAMGTAIGSVICLLSLLTHAVSPDVGLAVACALPVSRTGHDTKPIFVPSGDRPIVRTVL